MQLTPQNTRAGYLALWGRMQIRPEKRDGFERYARLIAAGRPQYEEVEKAIGAPWWFVGIVHLRESNCNFKTALHNGDPLWDKEGNPLKTVHVPTGRGPFKTWADAAIDALKMRNLHLVKEWDIPRALYEFEAYNGFGYVKYNINSPYVWAGTNLYSRGKYIADGKFSALFIDPQPGAAAMLASMILLNLIPTLAKQVISMATTATTAPMPTSTANTSTGVTISPGHNLSTHALAAVGAWLMALGYVHAADILSMIASPDFLGGAVVLGLSGFISRFVVNGSNANTLDLIDKVLVALTPAANKSPLTAVGPMPDEHTAAAPPAAA